MARYGLFVLKVPLNPNQPTPTLSVLVGWTLSKTQNLSTGPTFPVFRISSPRDEIHCSAMWWDSTTTRQPTAHYHRSQQQELAPALFLVDGDGQDAAPFMDPADRRWYTVQLSCWMVQGSSSWPLWVDATDLCCLRDLMMMMMMMMMMM